MPETARSRRYRLQVQLQATLAAYESYEQPAPQRDLQRDLLWAPARGPPTRSRPALLPEEPALLERGREIGIEREPLLVGQQHRELRRNGNAESPHAWRGVAAAARQLPAAIVDARCATSR
jgi:hypothetical protein